MHRKKKNGEHTVIPAARLFYKEEEDTDKVSENNYVEDNIY